MKAHWRKTYFLLPLVALAFLGCMKRADEFLNVSRSSIEVDAEQYTPATIFVTSNGMWTVVDVSATWLSVSPTKNYGDTELDIMVTPNVTLTPRQASFILQGDKIRQEVKVTQRGEAAVLSLKEDAIAFDAEQKEFEVMLTTNVEVDITIEGLWVTEITGTKTVADNKRIFRASQNTDLAARSAKITFKQRGGSLSQQFTVTQLGEKPEILLPQESHTQPVEVGGGYITFDIISNVPWTATSTHSWVKVVESIETKAKKDSTCILFVEPNGLADERTALVQFTGKGFPESSVKSTLTVVQGPTTPTISFTPAESVNVSAAGTATNQRYSIEVDANFVWDVDTTGNNAPASWVSDVGKVSNSNTFTLKVATNDDLTTRSTNIIIKQVSSNYTRAYKLTQNASAPQLSVTPDQDYLNTHPIGKEGGTDPNKVTYLFITSNDTWDFAVDQPWLTVSRSPVTKGLQTEALSCAATPNTNSAPRSANVTITSATHKVVLTVRQQAGDEYLKAQTNKIETTGDESSHNLTVTANVPWSASASATWIVIEKAPVTKAPLVDSVIRINILSNPSFTPREGKVTITQTGGTLKEEVQIVQGGLVPKVTITPSAQSMHGKGGDVTLMINANYPIAFKNSGMESWVTIKPADTIAKQRYSFTFAPTGQLSPRTAHITFKNINGEKAVDTTFTLVQRGATISVADSTVLTRLYIGLSGVVWKERWELNRPVAEWAGIGFNPVVMEGERRVSEISLPGFNLFGVLENGPVVSRIPLEELTWLQKLNLSGNIGLGGELPVNLYKLRYLQELNLSGCSFANATSGRNIPAEWGGKDSDNIFYFHNLSILKVNANSLTGTIPQAIKDHPNYSVYWNPGVNILLQRTGSLLEP
ncbi:MAG: hypothetical protein LBC84_01885 [Prevotellaceae bacterium]|jgi:hypothetical protein|nr:hypothetical protein [Prevotellaceae bacterium]